jgi:cell division protease FtsH
MRHLLLLATISALFRFAVAFRRFESFPTKTRDVLKGGIAFHDPDLSKAQLASYKRRYGIGGWKKWYIKNQTFMANNDDIEQDEGDFPRRRTYPISRRYYEAGVKRGYRRSRYIEEDDNDDEPFVYSLEELFNNVTGSRATRQRKGGGLRLVIHPGGIGFKNDDHDDDDEDADAEETNEHKPVNNARDPFHLYRQNRDQTRDKKSENFEVVARSPVTFADIGGYDRIKTELYQCIDILSNYTKYAAYNVRVPKGLILDGPPGNGKTLLAKALAGEAGVAFIAVSGAEFQEKYVGVGAGRVRELFTLARKNIPCIVFIDEIDAIGRKRSGDGESSSNERDSTLNELLVALDGFQNTTGVFVVGATNRPDLLDPALVRPGRIDKRIFIGLPDADTREAILRIHSKGKPADASVVLKDMVDLTLGLSGAQIENLLNEAMLNALRHDRVKMTNSDIDVILNRMMAGWQPTEHQFTSDIVDHIAIHEMGHAVVGLLSKYHTKMTKVIINLTSPRSPAYTVFEGSTDTIYTKAALFEHLMILLAGRIAEEVFFDVTVTTGAINDFEEAFKLAEKMVIYYGMGKKVIYPSSSEKYKEMIDNEVVQLINDAYDDATFIVQNAKEFILEGASMLKRDKVLRAETMLDLIATSYPDVLKIKLR